MKNKSRIGVIGLGVMGSSLARNIQDKGFSLSVYDKNQENTSHFQQKWKLASTQCCVQLTEFLDSLEKPRCVLMMVTAGPVVDSVIDSVLPYLDKGDIVIDAGNSYYQDTRRRENQLKEQGIYFLGMGVSGGEKGALEGPSMMPGGDRQAYLQVQDIFEAIAAKTKDGRSCCRYIGPDGAGHFIKMVHNGIEYADMQLIGEVYLLLRYGLNCTLQQIHEILNQWNQGSLHSYLMEITSQIVVKKDTETNHPLIEMILDCAGQKGTGNWTSKEALTFGVPIPAITDAVFARYQSGRKQERLKLGSIFPKGLTLPCTPSKLQEIEKAMIAARICSYAQGYDLMQNASDEFHWDLNFHEISQIWQAGCIIQSSLTQQIALAYQQESKLNHLLMANCIATSLQACLVGWRKTATLAVKLGIGMPILCGTLSYFDSFTAPISTAGIIQAQRDCFGAHTYQRIDKPGVFHTEW